MNKASQPVNTPPLQSGTQSFSMCPRNQIHWQSSPQMTSGVQAKCKYISPLDPKLIGKVLAHLLLTP